MKHKETVIYILAFGFILSLIAGCSEKPEARAAKEARQQAQKALSVVEDYKLDSGYDYSQARQEVDKAVALASKAGGMADSVYFASAELTSAYASKQLGGISALQEELAKDFQDAASVVLKLSESKSQLDTIEMLMATGKAEADQLQELLAGQKQGIETKLAETKNELSKYEASLKNYQDAAAAAKKAADQIQLAADKMLRDAQLLVGEKRIELERKAYALMQGTDSGNDDKSVFYYNGLVQKNLDLAQAVSVSINTVKPLIAKLESDVESLAVRIDELKNQDKTLGFSEQITTLGKQFAELKSNIIGKLEAINSKLDEYQQKVAEQTSLYVEAQEDYAKAKAEGLRQNAQLQIAECSQAIAELNAQSFDFAKRIAVNAKSIADIDVDDVTSLVGRLHDKFQALVTDYSQKAREAYDKAFEEYQSVLDRYSTGQFADVTVRSYMSAMYSRINFDSMAQDAKQIKDDLLAKVEQIKEISIQTDPSFANSKIASLFTKYGMEFKSAEQKLQESYLELKVEFAAAMSLQDQAKQEKLLELLEKFNNLEKPQDEQFYNDLVKYIYDSFRDNWIAISQAEPENESLAVFREFIARDTQPEEVAEESGMGRNDPNS